MLNQRNLASANEHSKTGWGIFWASVSVLCWATLFPAVSFLLTRKNIDCYSMAMLRFFIGGIVMLVSIGFLQKKLPTQGINLLDFLLIAIHSLFAASMSVLLFYGQSLGIPLVNAALLESEAPLIIFVLSIFILRGKVTFLQCLGLIVGFIGSMLVLQIISQQGLMINSFAIGDFMVFLAAFCWALYTVLSNKIIKRLGGLLYTAWSLLFAGIGIFLFQVSCNLPISIPSKSIDVVVLLYLAIVPTAVAFFSWNNAQKYITPGLLAISGYFTPMLTALLGWIFFNQAISWVQLIGMILVINSALIEPEISKFVREYWKNKWQKKYQ